MPLILNLDTSTQICSVALASEGKLLGSRESFEDKSHAKQLSIFISDLISEHGIDISKLDAIAVSKGPGSYTGLRIGVATAKGIAYGSNIPLIGIGTLDALISGALQNEEINEILKKDRTALLCPMIDARRMEVYTSLYTSSGKCIEDVSARIIDENTFLDTLKSKKIVFFGNGASKCVSEINNTNAIFVSNIETTAVNMISLAEKYWNQKRFEDLAYFEPLYLKDFIATIPKNKIIPGMPPTT